MLVKIFDLLTTIIQSVLFVWVCNNIASKENKINKLKEVILILILFINSFIFSYMNINNPYANIIMIVIALTAIILFYRKSMVDGLLGFGLTHILFTMITYFVMTIYKKVAINTSFGFSTDVYIVLFIYVPAFICYFFIYMIRKYLFNLIIIIKSYKLSLTPVLLLNYALILGDTFRSYWQTEGMEFSFKNTFYIVAFIAFIFTIIYFAKVRDKAREVDMLNAALNEKMVELKKIKHDYGSEISGLYGLYQMGKVDKIGDMLKDIVNRYQGLNTAVKVSIGATPMVSSILDMAVSKGIDVIANDDGDYENLNISDNDLLKLLSNIIKNSIEALNTTENKIIKFKSYNSYDGITITIMNNGPEIPPSVINNMFNPGFSTKENITGDRGYGLNIVKEIINKCNGKIFVDSNKDWTQFKIEIPNKAR